MKLIICLGNPGLEYSSTRHNAGFLFGEALAKKLNADFTNEPKFKSQIAKAAYNNEALWIVKPQTFMNLSGEALNALKGFYKVDIKTLFLAYDDISLELGKIRFRPKGSDGGHNGVKSIIQYAKTEEFDRLKIGIGPQPPYMKSENFVLQNFSADERKILDNTINISVEAFLYYCDNDIYKAQNKYN